jgi:FkbM family methyltransferase
MLELAQRAAWVVYKAPAPWWIESHLRDVLRVVGFDTALDVGAHVGAYAWRLRHVAGFGGPIVSFEPDPHSMAAARQKMAGDAAWTGVPLALGRVTERRVLHVHARTDFSSFRPMTPYGAELWGQEVVREEEVDVARLDDVAGQYLSPGARVLLKVDTQGFDVDVIEGGRKTLEDHVVALQVEVPIRNLYEDAPSLTEMVALVDDLGFDVTWISPVARRPDLRLDEVDFVARRRDA